MSDDAAATTIGIRWRQPLSRLINKSYNIISTICTFLLVIQHHRRPTLRVTAYYLLYFGIEALGTLLCDGMY